KAHHGALSRSLPEGRLISVGGAAPLDRSRPPGRLGSSRKCRQGPARPVAAQGGRPTNLASGEGEVQRRLLALAGIVLGISLTPLAGQPTLTPRGNGFRFDSPLSLSAGRDEGFPAAGGKVSDTVSILEFPGLALVSNSRRLNFSLDYKPEFEWFQEHRKMDAWNHTAVLHFDERITRHTSLQFGDAFVSTEDPMRRLPENLFLLPRGRYQQNSAFVALGHRLSQQTSIGLRFDNSTITATQPFKFDQVGNDWTVT